MAFYYGINSNYASSLFSSLNKSNDSYSGLTGFLQDYASIKNGSYGRLLNKYYSVSSDNSENGKVSSTDKSTATSDDKVKTLKEIEKDTDALKESADVLIKSGSDSVFRKVSKTDEKGNVTREYDTDKIYGAVKDFVDDYNAVLDSTEESKASSIASNRRAMMNTTKANESLLSSVGITADEDGNLTIDEKKFKDSDMSTVKSLFNGTGSYAYQTSAKASMINYNAQTEQNKANTYTSTGAYSYNYSSGAFYDNLF